MRRTETFPITGSRTTVTVDLPSGSIDVRTGADGSLSVSVDSDQPDEWEVSQFGDLVTVRAPRRRGLRMRSAKVYVEAPAGTHLDVNAASADVALSGPLGEVRIRTASGDMRADQVERLEVGSASGDVKVNSVVGSLTVSTASGDIRAGRVGDDVHCGTASGDVRIGCCTGSSIDIKTVSGDIQLGLPSGIRVEPDITTMSGRTTLPTTPPAPASASATEPRRNVRVRLRAVSGDITIDRVTH